MLQTAGHTDFRDARGPLGFTQRQAGGKFTRGEADEFIERLQQEAESVGEGDGEPGPAAAPARVSAAELALRKVPAEQLAAELQRRGWVVMEP
ncbi:MAG: hypothetical protein JWL70_68 [Acidimicrobiia bacterium]|nr:hypothetical protein [Acidimicrobiia bacterium]